MHESMNSWSKFNFWQKFGKYTEVEFGANPSSDEGGIDKYWNGNNENGSKKKRFVPVQKPVGKAHLPFIVAEWYVERAHCADDGH